MLMKWQNKLWKKNSGRPLPLLIDIFYRSNQKFNKDLIALQAHFPLIVYEAVKVGKH